MHLVNVNAINKGNYFNPRLTYDKFIKVGQLFATMLRCSCTTEGFSADR